MSKTESYEQLRSLITTQLGQMAVNVFKPDHIEAAAFLKKQIEALQPPTEEIKE